MQGRWNYLEFRSGSRFSSWRFSDDFQWPGLEAWMTIHITVKLPRKIYSQEWQWVNGTYFHFSCLVIITNMVLSFPCTMTSAGMGGPLASFTQTLAPIACISFVDPNPPSPLLIRWEVLLFVLCQLHMDESAIWQFSRLLINNYLFLHFVELLDFSLVVWVYNSFMKL